MKYEVSRFEIQNHDSKDQTLRFSILIKSVGYDVNHGGIPNKHAAYVGLRVALPHFDRNTDVNKALEFDDERNSENEFLDVFVNTPLVRLWKVVLRTYQLLSKYLDNRPVLT